MNYLFYYILQHQTHAKTHCVKVTISVSMATELMNASALNVGLDVVAQVVILVSP